MIEKMTEQEKRWKELIKELLRDLPLKDGQHLSNIMKEFIVEIVNGILEGELEDKLSYENYDVKIRKRITLEKGWAKKPSNQLRRC